LTCTKDISVFKLLLTNCSWSAIFGCPHSSDRALLSHSSFILEPNINFV
jgi:hypothetical protein